MKIYLTLLICLSISISINYANEQTGGFKCNGAQLVLMIDDKSGIIEILERVKKESFELDDLKAMLKEEYCSSILFETNEDLSCKLKRSITKELKARRVYVTTEPAKKARRSVSLIFSGYGKKDYNVRLKLQDDFESLTDELWSYFFFVKEEFHEGEEAAERIEWEFSNEEGITIQVVKLFGGCHGFKRIVLSIIEEENDASN